MQNSSLKMAVFLFLYWL